jgi:uncharacterized protein (DUF111 family)
MLVAGLAAMAEVDQDRLDAFLDDLGLSSLVGRIKLEKKSLNGICGHALGVELPAEHVHRTLSDAADFFKKSSISDRAKNLAINAFTILAVAEGRVHDRKPEEVHFHEVGALDSLLDIGLACVLFDLINPGSFISGPLPICDGSIKCAHGLLASPAPAVSILLEGVLVRGIDSQGETVTPTGIALLKSFGVRFGLWPQMLVERQALVYGSRILPSVPNGALFVRGMPSSEPHDLNSHPLKGASS